MAETVEASATSPGDPTPGAEASPSFAVGDQVSVFEQASGPDATTLHYVIDDAAHVSDRPVGGHFADSAGLAVTWRGRGLGTVTGVDDGYTVPIYTVTLTDG